MALVIERRRKDGSVDYLAQIAIKRKGKWAHREARRFDRSPTAAACLTKRMNKVEAMGNNLGALKRKGKTLADAIDRYLKDSGDSIGKTTIQVLETIRDEYDLSKMPAEDIESADHERPVCRRLK